MTLSKGSAATTNHIYTIAYIHIRIHIYKYTNTHTCKYVHTPVYICIHKSRRTYVCTQKYVSIHVHTYIHTRVVRIRTNNSQSPFGTFATGRSRRPLNLATRPTLSGAFHRAPLLWDTVRPDPSFRAYPGRESHAFGRRFFSFSLVRSCQRNRTK